MSTYIYYCWHYFAIIIIIIIIILIQIIQQNSTKINYSIAAASAEAAVQFNSIHDQIINNTDDDVILYKPSSSSSSSSSLSNETWRYNLITNKSCTNENDCHLIMNMNMKNKNYLQHYHCHLKLNRCVICLTSSSSSSSSNNYCINESLNNRTNEWIRRMPMLPISIVLIVSMFICLCIVLQLFAKARFRNTQRSIFANPQKLELAKAQERRLSQLSQLSSVVQHHQSSINLKRSGSQIYTISYQKQQQQHNNNNNNNHRLSLPQASKLSIDRKLSQQNNNIQLSAIVGN